MTNIEQTDQVEALLDTPDLADALESEQFRRFLDEVPIAVVISEIKGRERIVYVNREFEKISGHRASEIKGSDWSVLLGQEVGKNTERDLGAALKDSKDYVGTFRIGRGEREPSLVHAYSNIIENDDGTPAFRLAALLSVGEDLIAERKEFEQQLREKDTSLLEIQHRVKNNLQMITALIRMEARTARGRIDTTPFDRLAGRIESIQLVYKLLSDSGQSDEIDLGVYLSAIASSVMHSHGGGGIRLELKVDAYPVSVNVAMPTGLVVNELLTNALKHAFDGRDSGTISLQSLTDDKGCRVIIADDGIGLPDGIEWPKRGKLGALIVRSLLENAKAQLNVQSSRESGTRVTIAFTRAASAPEIPEPVADENVWM